MRKELFVLPLLLIIVAGCIQLPGGAEKDCGNDWACFTAAAADCSSVKVTRTEVMDDMTLKMEFKILGGGPETCNLNVHPLELQLPADADDEMKAMAAMVSFLDMTCQIAPTEIKDTAMSPEQLDDCEGSLAELLKEAMAGQAQLSQTPSPVVEPPVEPEP